MHCEEGCPVFLGNPFIYKRCDTGIMVILRIDDLLEENKKIYYFPKYDYQANPG